MAKKSFVRGMACLGMAGLLGCWENPADGNRKPAPANPGPESQVELAFPGRTGTPAQGYYRGKLIQYEIIDGVNVFQGDMILRSKEISQTPPLKKTSGAGRQPWQWGNDVPYAFDAALPADLAQKASQAMDRFRAKVNWVFAPNAVERIFFRQSPGAGCDSDVGRMEDDATFVNIGHSCDVGVLMHEIGHALGLWHEHTRLSRDNDIIIHWNNIQPNIIPFFRTFEEQGGDGFDWLPFDFNSMMMYGPTDFGIVVNGHPKTTLSARSGRAWTRQRVGLSAGDWATLEVVNPTSHPRWISSVANAPGSLDLFVTRRAEICPHPNSCLEHPLHGEIMSTSWKQGQSNGAFDPWRGVLGGKAQWGGPVTAISRAPGVMDVFVVSTTNVIVRAAWDANRDAPGAFRGWWNVSGGQSWPGTSVVPVSRAPNKLDIFTVAMDGSIQTSGYDANVHGESGWGTWRIINGSVFAASGTQLAAVSRGPNSLDVFTIGADGQIYMSIWDGSSSNFSQWNPMGWPEALSTQVSAIARGGKLDVFAVGVTGKVYHKAFNGSTWTNWENIMGWVVAGGSRVAVVSRASSSLDIFALAQDRRVAWGKKGDGSAWQSMGQLLGGIAGSAAQLSAVSRSFNKMDVFATGGDGQIWTAVFNGIDWSGWHQLPGI